MAHFDTQISCLRMRVEGGMYTSQFHRSYLRTYMNASARRDRITYNNTKIDLLLYWKNVYIGVVDQLDVLVHFSNGADPVVFKDEIYWELAILGSSRTSLSTIPCSNTSDSNLVL